MAQPIRSASQRTTSQRPSMPHVSTMAVDVKTVDARKSLSSQRSRATIEAHRSAPSSPRRKGFGDQNSVLLVATPENSMPDFNSVKHKRHNSSEAYSASSGGESIFELPTVTFESPNSSTATSFVAELEDTSALGYSPSPPTMLTRVPSMTDTAMLFKSNKFTSRAIIKVVDETIAAIEASNRELTARAEAAEAVAYRLREENTRLQIELDECRNAFGPRPTAPLQCSATQTTPRHSPSNSLERKPVPVAPTLVIPTTPTPNTPISHKSSNKSLLEIPTISSPTGTDSPTTSEPERKKSLKNLRFLYRNQTDTSTSASSSTTQLNTNPLSSNPPTAEERNLLKQRRASADRPRTADASTQPKHMPPPVPELPTSPTHLAPHSKSHTRSHSLEDAKKLVQTNSNGVSKPLPPLGPMSPSVVQGVVEIGLGGQDPDNDKFNSNLKVEGGKALRTRKSWGRFRVKGVGNGGIVIFKDFISGEDKGREKEKDKRKASGKVEVREVKVLNSNTNKSNPMPDLGLFKKWGKKDIAN